jgi:hypothetical protein
VQHVVDSVTDSEPLTPQSGAGASCSCAAGRRRCFVARVLGHCGTTLLPVGAGEIRHELVMLPYYGVFDNLVYKVDGYKVTLMGQVTRPTLKNDAERVVKDIEGVEQVINNIEVLPVSPNDDRIRLAVYTAIYGHTALNRYALNAFPPIHIIAGRRSGE